MHHLWPCGPSGKRVQKTLGTPFESQQNASRLIVDWIQFDNNRRPRQTFGMKAPAGADALAA